MLKQKLLHAALFTPLARGRWGLPLLAWGPPGVGKSSVIAELGRACGLPVEVLSPGERGEGAFGVTPVPTSRTLPNGSVMTELSYPAPDWVARMWNGGIVFLDELTTAAPAIQAPMLGLIQERRIGSITLPGRVRVIAAANPTEEAAGGYDLAAPIANRLGHFDWPAISASDWSDFMLSAGQGEDDDEVTVDAVREEARVSEAWPLAWAKARGLVTAFISKRPELLFKKPNPNDTNISRAWPSPRSMENATRALASADVHHLTESDADTLMAAFIGLGATSEFAAFRVSADLPDPEALLDGRERFSHDKRRLDRTAAVVQSCTALITPPNAKHRIERATAFWTIMDSFAKEAVDLVVPAVRVLKQADLINPCKAAAEPVLARVLPALRACEIGTSTPTARRR